MAAACSAADEAGADLEKPVIASGAVASPADCQVYHRGETVAVRYVFSDNVELGNYNIEVHNNFDHHSHSTSAGDCDFDPKKQPVRPWVYNRSFAIPDGSRR